jgi:hypothetical protein
MSVLSQLWSRSNGTEVRPPTGALPARAIYRLGGHAHRRVVAGGLPAVQQQQHYCGGWTPRQAPPKVHASGRGHTVRVTVVSPGDVHNAGVGLEVAVEMDPSRELARRDPHCGEGVSRSG